MNNISTIVPKSKGKKQQQVRVTTKARDRSTSIQSTSSVVQRINIGSCEANIQLDCNIQKNEIPTAVHDQQMQRTEQEHLRRMSELELEIDYQKKINKGLINQDKHLRDE